jgi:hypothetical protein
LEHKNIRMLFTGDAEDPTEHELLMQAVGDIDLLKVAHHGSGHSTSRAFLEATQPEIALISAGAGNRYRHPSSDTLERLAEAKAIVYRTDLSGHLHVISDGDTLEVLEGPLDELIGITVAANAQPPKPTTSVSEPAPIKDLPWIAAGTNDSVAVERSLEELLIQISDRRKAERKEMKDLRAKHKANRQADLLQIRAAKQDTQRQTAEQ